MDRPLTAIMAVVLAPTVALGIYASKREYDSLVADAAGAHAAVAAGQRQAADLRRALDDAGARMKARDRAFADLSTHDHGLQAQLDEQTAINEKLRAELESLGKNVDAMLAEKGTLAKALDDAKARLEELRKAQAAAEARAALFEQLVGRFKAMAAAGQIAVATRAGRLVLRLPSDELFDPGQSTIKPAGREAVAQVAGVLETLHGRAFQVAGDTDDAPLLTARFPSSWELSSARAVEVVKLLVARGVDPRTLSAAGYGQFDPIAGDDSPDGREKNRRVEIALQPNVDELVAAPTIP